MDLTRFGLLGAIVLAGILAGIAWYRSRGTPTAGAEPSVAITAVGLVTEFGDTLGIGCFAPNTALFKFFKLVPDELIPGTLIVGTMAGVILQALIFITSVAVEPVLLASMVLIAALGAWLGAGIVAAMPRRAIQFGMGGALLVAACVFTAVNLGLLPGGGEALALEGWKFALALGASFVLGALMTIGIGMYAPTMIVVSLLGMSPLAAFPIMMGACALLQPIAAFRFIAHRKFAFGASLGLAAGGVIGVLIATYVVKSLPLYWLRWGVVVVVTIAAVSMLYSALKSGAVSRQP
jgi:uncharacterized membrane protein YfcA